jgi:hypothetical protein
MLVCLIQFQMASALVDQESQKQLAQKCAALVRPPKA